MAPCSVALGRAWHGQGTKAAAAVWQGPPPGEPLLLRPHPRAGPATYAAQAAPGVVRAAAHAAARSTTARPSGSRGWWPTCTAARPDLWQRQAQEVEFGWQVMEDYQRWLLLRRISSRRQVQEVMTEFWENHLNVPADGDGAFTWRVDYGDTIRAHALGRFDDLLSAATTHPAMLHLPRQRHLHEGRTPTRTSAASCWSCTPSAAATTPRTTSRTPPGSSPAGASTCGGPGPRRTPPRTTATGPVKVMGFSDPNRTADGREVTRDYLQLPGPPPGDRAARRAPAGGQVRRATTRRRRWSTGSPRSTSTTTPRSCRCCEASSPRTAFRAAARHQGPRPRRGRRRDLPRARRRVAPPAQPTTPRANAVLWQADGRRAVARTRGRVPTAAPIDNDVVGLARPGCSASMRMHWVDGRRLVARARTSPTASPRLGCRREAVRFDELVDHLVPASLLTARRPSTLLKACCQATGLRRRTSDHQRPRPGRVGDAPPARRPLLDSPAHLTR